MKRYLIILLISAMPLSAFAGTSTDKIRTLMEALDLIDMWSEQIELGKVQNKKMGQQALNQIMAQLNPSEEFIKRFSDAFNNYMKKTEAPWSAEEIVEVWAGYYGPNFSDEELDKLIEFYTSELGRKEVAVTKQTMTKFAEHFQKAVQPIFENACFVPRQYNQ